MMSEFIYLLLKGMLIGLTIAAPVGPIGVLCIKRTMEQGKGIGFASGLGAATADGIYGIIAGLGLTVITNFLVGIEWWLQLIGGLFLCYLGIQILRSKPTNQAAAAKNGATIMKAYTSTLFLTITNPMTILSFVAIFSGVGLASMKGSGLVLACGVFLGSASWWLFLSVCVGWITSRLGKTTFQLFHYISGGIMLIFGLSILFS